MMHRFRILTPLAVALLLNGQGAWAADPKSPEAVKTALRVLAYVQADMAGKLAAKAYARLPHESQEFREASVALRDAIAADPAELRARVEAALEKALKASEQVSQTSRSNDGARIAAAVTAVDTALKALDALFPLELRPVSGGEHPSGPPPGLR